MLGSPFLYSGWPYELSSPKLAHMHQLLESSPHRQPHIVSQQSKLISHSAPRHVLRKLPLPQPAHHPLAADSASSHSHSPRAAAGHPQGADVLPGAAIQAPSSSSLSAVPLPSVTECSSSRLVRSASFWSLESPPYSDKAGGSDLQSRLIQSVPWSGCYGLSQCVVLLASLTSRTLYLQSEA